MKNPERARELIAELKSLAENQFELHRIEVLERDLQSPPTPEIIDETRQKFDNIVYSKVRVNSHYNCAGGLHRAVYTYYYGEIPEGYEIHHVDENKNNNDISNLVAMTKSEHLSVHYESKLKQRKKKFKCQDCGEEFEGIDNGRIKFCPECRNPEKICPVCGKKFRPAWGRKAVCCSFSCGAKLRYKGHLEERQCAICGKSFKSPISHPTQCCSKECGYKFREINRKL